MSALRIESAGYRYPSAAAPALVEVTTHVSSGEVVLLTGPTGCGKSTLLRLAAGLLARHGAGEVHGAVRIDGADPARTAPSERVRQLGFVSQEPGDQLVAGTVGDELAFGMESAGMAPAEIDAAIPRLLARTGLEVGPERACRALSGGQVQRLVTGAALAAGAGVLLLDEPLAQLDPAGAAALMGSLRRLADGGCAVLVVEHRLEPCWPWVDRVLLMDGGRIAAEAARAEVGPGHPLIAALRARGIAPPGLLDLADRLGADPAEVGLRAPTAPPAPTPGRSLARCSGLRVRHRGAERDALHGVELAVHAGERVALVGANGAGKSTLLGALAGRLRAAGVRVEGRVVEVPQDPDLALFCRRVDEEIGYGPAEQGARGAELAARVAQAARALSVEGLLDRPPQALSRGQRLRVAVASALACAPELLLLDEPTSGQDHAQVEQMMASLGPALAEGALVFATHDLDLALRHATRVVVLHQGEVLADGPPATVLSALPEALPLPPLARFCLERGLPPATAAALAEGA